MAVITTASIGHRVSTVREHRAGLEGDRRGQNAELTDVGRRRYGEARVTHLADVRSRFLSQFSRAELEILGAFWERISPGATAE